MSQLQRVAKLNTTITHHGVGIVVRLYETNVVETSPEIIRLNTGGWFTATTRTRMNQASNQWNLGYWVHQIKGNWFARYRGIEIPFNGEVCLIERKGEI